MAVRASYTIADKPLEDMEMAITVTMTVSEWRNFTRNLPRGYETNHVGWAVAEALGHITRATSRSYVYPDPADKE